MRFPQFLRVVETQQSGSPHSSSSPAEDDTEDAALTFPGEPSTPKVPYPYLLYQLLHSLGLSYLLVEGPPPSNFPSVVPPGELQGSKSLGFNDYMLLELLDTFKVPYALIRLVDHTSQFCITEHLPQPLQTAAPGRPGSGYSE